MKANQLIPRLYRRLSHNKVIVHYSYSIYTYHTSSSPPSVLILSPSTTPSPPHNLTLLPPHLHFLKPNIPLPHNPPITILNHPLHPLHPYPKSPTKTLPQPPHRTTQHSPRQFIPLYTLGMQHRAFVYRIQEWILEDVGEGLVQAGGDDIGYVGC